MKQIVFLFLLILSDISLGQALLRGKVVRVSDGDTIVILTDDNTQIKVRLSGVDCPESKQDFGTRAKQFTSEFCFGKTVKVMTSEKDRYGRYLGSVSLLTGKNLNEELLKAGLAWHYKYFDQSIKLSNLERIARKNQKGIWSMPNPIAPWDFRRASKQYSY